MMASRRAARHLAQLPTIATCAPFGPGGIAILLPWMKVSQAVIFLYGLTAIHRYGTGSQPSGKERASVAFCAAPACATHQTLPKCYCSITGQAFRPIYSWVTEKE